MNSTNQTFKEQSVAMGHICSELMHELVTVDGHTYNFKKPALPENTMVEIEYENHVDAVQYSTMMVQRD